MHAVGACGQRRDETLLRAAGEVVERWAVAADGLASRGKNTPLLRMSLAGRVLLTMAGGRIAYEAPAD